MDFPIVNPDICTGCGLCIDVCSMDAIFLDEGTAFIDEDKCSNCRACENECPVVAIY